MLGHFISLLRDTIENVCWKLKVVQQNSIHPSIIFCLFEIGSLRQQIREGNPDIALPSDTLQLLGDPKVFVNGHPNEMSKPPQLTFDAEEQWFYSKLLPDG